MATFGRGWKVAMKLPGSAVWGPKPPVCWKPAMKLPRSAVWDHSAENRPWNCQGRQFENINLVMDRANGWKAAMKLPRSAVWGPKGPKCWKLAMKLPRSAVWERGRETAKVGSLSPQKKVWFKLPTLAVLWPLFQTARYGRVAQVISFPTHTLFFLISENSYCSVEPILMTMLRILRNAYIHISCEFYRYVYMP